MSLCGSKGLARTINTNRCVYGLADALDIIILAIGITNQRETTCVWDRLDGKPLHHAIGNIPSILLST